MNLLNQSPISSPSPAAVSKESDEFIKSITHLIAISARGDGDELVCHFNVVTP